MNEKAKQLLGELEMLGERSNFWYEDFWITRSPIGGYTVVSVKRTITEHFSKHCFTGRERNETTE